MALMSMTGFADRAGSSGGLAWVWEARSVNGRGLDVRVRLPEGCEGLEAPLRAAAGRAFARGSVTVGLRTAAAGAGTGGLRLNEAALAAAIAAAGVAAAEAEARGLALAPLSPGELLSVRGVLEAEGAGLGVQAEVLEALAADIPPLLAALAAARAAEGAALAGILAGQIERMAALIEAARGTAEARAARAGALLRSRVEALIGATGAVDEARLAQELALIAVKADLTEEIDRLEGHVAAARELIGGSGPVGRRLDFLTQEFNREANTLCSKAQAADLTAIGLEMKVVIDQIREQVQNVE